MSINPDSIIANLNQDAKAWQFVGAIKDKQKIEIVVDKEGNTTDLRVSEGRIQSVNRAVKKLFGTIASAEPTITWINASKLKTRKNLTELSEAVHLPRVDPKVLKSSLATLKELKTQIDKANEGLEAMKITYKGRVTKGGQSIPVLIAKEQEDLTKKLSVDITNLIVVLGEKLQNVQSTPQGLDTAMALESMQEAIAKAQKERNDLVSNAFVARAEDIPSLNLDTLEAEDTSTINLAELVKSYYAPAKKDTDEVVEKKKQIQRELIQGKKNDIKLVEIKSKHGKVQMPGQFSKDLFRIRSFRVGQEQFRFENLIKDPVTPYQRLCNLFKAEGPEIAPLVASRVASVMSQSNIADINVEVLTMANQDSTVFINAEGSGQYYSVDVIDDKVKITMKLSFALTAHGEPEPDHGAIIVKREIEIPLSDLEDPDLLTSKEPLLNVKVMDTYSKRIQSAEYAEELLKVF